MYTFNINIHTLTKSTNFLKTDQINNVYFKICIK